MEEYPLRKYDKLNRLIYIDFNGVERVIKIYWDDTEKVKIKYRLWKEDVEVEAYDKNGKKIFSSSGGRFNFELPRIKIRKDEIFYTVDKKKIKEWMIKLECLKK